MIHRSIPPEPVGFIDVERINDVLYKTEVNPVHALLGVDDCAVNIYDLFSSELDNMVFHNDLAHFSGNGMVYELTVRRPDEQKERRPDEQKDAPTVRKHIDGLGELFLASNIMPTIAWVGEFDIPDEHAELYGKLTGGHYGRPVYPGNSFFTTEAGRRVTEEAVSDGFLVRCDTEPGVLYRFDRHTIHSADPDVPRYIEAPRRVLFQANSEVRG